MDPRKFYRLKREHDKAERRRSRWLDYLEANPKANFPSTVSSSRPPPAIQLDDTPTLGIRIKRWGVCQTPKRKCTPMMADNKWVEKDDNEAEPTPPPPPPNALTDRECTVEGVNGDMEEKICRCGLGGCLVLTENTEKSRGRNMSSSFNKGSSSGEANSVRSCYKCGQDGHRAKECMEPSSGSPGFDGTGHESRLSGTCYKCGVPGHWAKYCVMKSSSGGGASVGVVGKSESSCYKCFKSGHWARDCPATEENGGCGFSEWSDNTSTTTPAAKAQYSVYNAAQSPSSTFPDVPCPCGAGICLILTAKTEKNMGQQFYRCPASQESKCNFFKWCIERNSTIGQQSSTNLKTFSNMSSSFNKGSSSGEANRVRSCYKCGQDGHRAKDCMEPSSGSPGFDGIGRESRLSGTCYKCGVPGHWAKYCVMKASSGGGAPVGVGGKSESLCYKCFKPGHWARDCPSQDRKVGQ